MTWYLVEQPPLSPPISRSPFPIEQNGWIRCKYDEAISFLAMKNSEQMPLSDSSILSSNLKCSANPDAAPAPKPKYDIIMIEYHYLEENSDSEMIIV